MHLPARCAIYPCIALKCSLCRSYLDNGNFAFSSENEKHLVEALLAKSELHRERESKERERVSRSNDARKKRRHAGIHAKVNELLATVYRLPFIHQHSRTGERTARDGWTDGEPAGCGCSDDQYQKCR